VAVGHPQTVEPEKEKSMSETIEFAEFKRVEMKVGKDKYLLCFQYASRSVVKASLTTTAFSFSSINLFSVVANTGSALGISFFCNTVLN
jgi:hypothetical protein